MTAVLDTEAGLNLVRKSCLLQAWARQAITTKATHLCPAASSQIDGKEVIRLEVQPGQGFAEPSFQVVTIWPLKRYQGQHAAMKTLKRTARKRTH